MVPAAPPTAVTATVAGDDDCDVWLATPGSGGAGGPLVPAVTTAIGTATKADDDGAMWLTTPGAYGDGGGEGHCVSRAPRGERGTRMSVSNIFVRDWLYYQAYFSGFESGSPVETSAMCNMAPNTVNIWFQTWYTTMQTPCKHAPLLKKGIYNPTSPIESRYTRNACPRFHLVTCYVTG